MEAAASRFRRSAVFRRLDSGGRRGAADVLPYPALAGLPAIAVWWPRGSAANRGWACAPGAADNTAWRSRYLLTLCVLPAGGRAGHPGRDRRLRVSHARAGAALELFHRLESPRQATNAQIWWALSRDCRSAGALRRFTRAPVFSLMFAAMTAMLCLATLLRVGVARLPGPRPRPLLLRSAALRRALHGRRIRLGATSDPDDSRYFYPFAVVFTWPRSAAWQLSTNRSRTG